MMTPLYSELEGSGTIKCLLCKQVMKYPVKQSEWRCKCGNLFLQFGEPTKLTDWDGRHSYSVIPDEFLEVEKYRVFVDMDDTLALNEYPYHGEPNWKLIDQLIQLPERYKLYVYTCRLNPSTVGGKKEAEWHHSQLKQFLRKHTKLGRFQIWTETIKPYAGMLIDDNCFAPAVAVRAFKFFL